jgi:lysozyme
MEVSRRGIRMIQHYEGLRLKAYLDSAGVPTIGYGSTMGVKMGDEITEAQALEFLEDDIERHADPVREAVDVPINQNQFDALVSFVFNVGAGAFRASTLLRKINTYDYMGAADELPRWVHAGGRELEGLKLRRASERSLFLESAIPSTWLDEVAAIPRKG